MDIPQHIQQKNSLLSKLTALCFLIGLSLIASFSVLGLGMERSSRADDAVDEMAAKWGRKQTVTGAVVTIPMEER